MYLFQDDKPVVPSLAFLPHDDYFSSASDKKSFDQQSVVSQYEAKIVENENGYDLFEKLIKQSRESTAFALHSQKGREEVRRHKH